MTVQETFCSVPIFSVKLIVWFVPSTEPTISFLEVLHLGCSICLTRCQLSQNQARKDNVPEKRTGTDETSMQTSAVTWGYCKVIANSASGKLSQTKS